MQLLSHFIRTQILKMLHDIQLCSSLSVSHDQIQRFANSSDTVAVQQQALTNREGQPHGKVLDWTVNRMGQLYGKVFDWAANREGKIYGKV